MDLPINWKDEYFTSKQRIVLTSEQLHIPGVRTFGMHDMQAAISPLQNHFHQDAFEITYVTKGSILFYAENIEYKVNGGDAFLVCPNEIHSTNETSMSLGKIYWIQLDVSHASRFLFLDKEAASLLIQKLYSIKNHNIRTDNQEIQAIITKAFSLALTPGNEMMIASYLIIYLHLLINFSREVQFPLTPDIGNSLNYILDHITSEISLDTLAEHCHMSTSYFKYKFKNQLGISPRNFINQQKIEHAKALLLDGQSITDVSMALSFSTTSYFSVVFKKYTSFTPSEYVQNSRANKNLRNS
ncbi:MAG: AraC family transcriptional regulator [Lachnospiraceae bacterium]|nr:AraC family transcriptional regulator [Lachnospiraceae bacterium]